MSMSPEFKEAVRELQACENERIRLTAVLDQKKADGTPAFGLLLESLNLYAKMSKAAEQVATLALKEDVADKPYDPPHSRACGIAPHYHGTFCAADCPTCGGK